MKHLMKKLTALFLATLMTLSLGAAWAGAEEQLTIGIIQFAEHSSLDNCREGFIAGLAEEGYVAGENVNFIEQNAQADMATVNQIAASMAEQCDLVCAIATPAPWRPSTPVRKRAFP